MDFAEKSYHSIIVTFNTKYIIDINYKIKIKTIIQKIF